MATAQSGLDRAVNAIDIKNPKIPIVANITAGKLSTAAEIKEELSRQLCSCVQWKDSVKTIIDMGVSTFLEFGPGRVLSGLVKRIDPGVSSVNAVELIKMGHMVNSGSRL
jgi:[acyl-carrier-protein] S-malonyltransferase